MNKNQRTTTQEGDKMQVNKRSLLPILTLLVGGLLPHNPAESQNRSKMFVTAYYDDWGSCGVTPQMIDYSAVTHIIHNSIEPLAHSPWIRFHYKDSTYFERGIGAGCNWPVQSDLIRLSHRNGVKVLLGLGGTGNSKGEFLVLTSDSLLLSEYVSRVSEYARSRGYDGFDVDWEFVYPRQENNFVTLMRRLRRELDTWTPRGVLTIAIPGTWGNWGYDINTMNTYVDQVNLMLYDMGETWDRSKPSSFNAPLHDPDFQGYHPLNDHNGVQSWIGQGLDKKRIGFGIPFYGFKWMGVNQPNQHGWSGAQYVFYSQIVADYLGKPGVDYNWDERARVPWLSVNSGSEKAFISYDNPQSITEKVSYAKQQELGGLMLFALYHGYDFGATRDTLLKTVKQAMAVVSTPPTVK
jgi:chitinase